jgi:hypothetical protein
MKPMEDKGQKQILLGEWFVEFKCGNVRLFNLSLTYEINSVAEE